MNIRQFHYFISVAEYLSFTKAAECHHIAQTSMSQQIQGIEQQLGVSLFIRNNRSVQLTPAGKIFLGEARRMTAMYEESVRKTQQAACGFAGSLKIGFMGPNEKHYLPELIRNFRRAYPNVELTLRQGSENLCKELEHGLLDIVFTNSYIAKSSDVVYTPLHSSPICVVMHRNNPLTQEGEIDPISIAHEPIIIIARQEYPGAFEAQLRLCAANGFIPNIVSEQSNIEGLLFMIEAEMGIGLLPRFIEVYASPNIRFVNMKGDAVYVDSVIAWHTKSLNPSVPLFFQELLITDGDKTVSP